MPDYAALAATLEEAATVVDEPYHREAVVAVMAEAAAVLRALTSASAAKDEEVTRTLLSRVAALEQALREIVDGPLVVHSDGCSSCTTCIARAALKGSTNG